MISISEKKVALVTGSGRGIGKAIAIALAKENYYVVVNSRNSEHVKKVVSEIELLGKKAIAVTGDLSREEDCKNIVDTTIKKFGQIDLLVNNAGTQKAIPLTEMTAEDWNKVLDVNLRGTFICSREAAKHMLKVGKGCIINISSVHQVIPKPLFVHYAASKGGLEMLTKTMALELARRGIRVNAVAPGVIATAMNKEMLESKKMMGEMVERIPMGRMGKPEEVANLVVFLASDKASYVTGTTFFVDGGLTLYPAFCIDCAKDGLLS